MIPVLIDYGLPCNFKQYSWLFLDLSVPTLSYFSFSGADIVGLNCCFDPSQSLEGMAMGKKALEEAGIKRHLIVQPLGCWTPDAGKDGYLSLPEAFLGEKNWYNGFTQFEEMPRKNS